MLKRLTATGILTFAVAGAAMVASAPANADINSYGGNGGVLSGNQVVVCGNSINVINVLPSAIAVCDGGGGGKDHHGYHH